MRRAASHMAATMTDERLGLPAGTLALVRRSIEAADPAIYARFDLVYGADGSIKMLEINGDTPTGLVETGVVQWRWLEDRCPTTTSGTASTTAWSTGGGCCATPARSTATTCTSSTTSVRATQYDGGEMEMTIHYLMDARCRRAPPSSRSR